MLHGLILKKEFFGLGDGSCLRVLPLDLPITQNVNNAAYAELQQLVKHCGKSWQLGFAEAATRAISISGSGWVSDVGERPVEFQLGC